jgi:hypothetical protein
MASPLIIDGAIAIRDGSVVITDDPSGCPCCGIDCGCGCDEFACCNPTEAFMLGAPPDCAVADAGTGEAKVTVFWRWVGCNFEWSILIVLTQAGGGGSINGNFTYPAASGCDAPVGAWTAGTAGNDGEFQATTDAPNRQCNINGATVTIAKTAGGYSFTVTGVTVDTDWDPAPAPFSVDCTDACDLLNGTWVVEC